MAKTVSGPPPASRAWRSVPAFAKLSALTRAPSRHPVAATLVLLVLIGLAVALSVRAQGWPSDNRIDIWLRGQENLDHAYGALRESFGGDEVVLLRASGFELEQSECLAWLDLLGERLELLPAVRGIADPFHLLGSPANDPIDAVEDAAVRPAARALELVDLDPVRVDFLLLIDPAAPQQLRGQLSAAVAELQEEASVAGVRLRAAGHALVAAAMDVESRRVEEVFAPLLGVAALVGVAVALRSLPLALLAMIPALLAAAGARAAMRQVGWDANLVLVSIGPLCLVILLASTLHLLGAFRQRLAQGMEPLEAARAARRDKLAAGLLAATTTAAGFAVFGLSTLEPVRRLGIGVAVTVAVVAPAMLFGLPWLLGRLPWRRPPAAVDLGGSRPWSRLAEGALRRRLTIQAAALGLAALGCWGAIRLPVGTEVLDYFPEGHPVREEFLEIEGEGAALSTFEVLARRIDGQRWQVLELGNSGLGKALAAPAAVRGVFGPEAVLNDASRALGPAAGLLGPVALQRAGRLADDGDWARWTVRYNTGTAEESLGVQAELERAVQDWRDVRPWEIQLTGTVPLLLRLQESLTGTLALSLVLTVLVISLLFLVVVRSLREFLAAMVVNLLPVASTMGFAWLAGFRLDAATVMVAAVLLGLAVDNSYHLLHAYRRCGGGREGVLQAFQKVGEAATVSSLALAAGFGILMFSGFAPTARFGALTAVGALTALAAHLFLLPVMLVSGSFMQSGEARRQEGA